MLLLLLPFVRRGSQEASAVESLCLALEDAAGRLSGGLACPRELVEVVRDACLDSSARCAAAALVPPAGDDDGRSPPPPPPSPSLCLSCLLFLLPCTTSPDLFQLLLPLITEGGARDSEGSELLLTTLPAAAAAQPRCNRCCSFPPRIALRLGSLLGAG